MRKEKTLTDMSRVCITKRPRAIDRLLNKVKRHFQVI